MRVLCLQRLGKQVDWPESAVPIRALRRPGPLWVAVQAVDQDDIDLGTRVGVDSCDVEPGDLPVDGSLNGIKSEMKAQTQLKQCSQSECGPCQVLTWSGRRRRRRC